MAAARLGADAARWISAAAWSPGWRGPRRGRGRGRGIRSPSIVGVPRGCDGDVDLNVVDDADGGFREVFAGGDLVDPRAGLLPFIGVAFVHVLEPGADVFVDNEMLLGAAPIFVRADVVSGTELNVVDPSRRRNSDCVSTASIDAGGWAVGGGSLVSGSDGRDGAISSSDGGDGAGFAS